MASKTIFLLLYVACVVFVSACSAQRPDMRYTVKRLMWTCQKQEYPVPKMDVLRTVFNSSKWPVEERQPDQSDPILSSFMNFLDSVFPGKGSPRQTPVDDKMTNVMRNCSRLLSIVNRMRNYSQESSVCYMRAFMAPLSWATLTTQSENNLDSDDYDTLLWGAKPMLLDMPSTRMELPKHVPYQNLGQMMKMLQGMYPIWSEYQRDEVAKWVKDQILQNNNCTRMQSSDSRLPMGKPCGSSANWLGDAFPLMGSYLSHIAATDVDSSPKEKLCEFFRTGQFQSALGTDIKMKPSLARRFLNRFQECFRGKEFAEQVDKLGVLTCYSHTAPQLTPHLSRKLLYKLSHCDNRGIKKLKEDIVQSVISGYNGTQPESNLTKQDYEISWKDFKEIQNNYSVPWTQSQMYTLVKQKLGKKCKQVSREDLMELQSVAGGLPNCVLQLVKAQDFLNDTEDLKKISRKMRKAQLKTILHRLYKDMEPTKLVQKLDGPLLRSIPVSTLAKVNVTSLDQVENKVWRLPQACYLARKLHGLKQLQYRRLHSILQCVTCKMINKVADTDVEEMAQALSDSPQWLSKMQTGCAARKLFATLERKRQNYFETVTDEEMEKIPASILGHLPPSKLQDLPDSVCHTFFLTMQRANFTSLPPRSPSRLALIQKALRCRKKDFSSLTSEDGSMLGPLLCQLSPSQLLRMAPNVLNSSLQAMASCQDIPRYHRAKLVQLVIKTFGDPSDWSQETMEKLGRLILLDDKVIATLSNKRWLKDVLNFLKPTHSLSNGLRKKLFVLTTTPTGGREKRTVNSEGSSSSSRTTDTKVPTVELIEELERENVYWTAEQFDQMSTATFIATVEILGNIPDFSSEQLAILSKKARETFGPVANMNETVVMRLGCIIQGFSNSELEKLPFLLETLEGISHCHWNESQFGPVWRAVALYNNLTAEQLGAAEIVALDQFICGLNTNEIGKLKRDAFKEALDSSGGVWCSMPIMRQLKVLAVSALNNPRTWAEEQVSELGNIIAGLDANELASLDPSVFPFIRKSCIPLIPPTNFASLSVAQLESFGPDNAEIATSEQKAALREEQLAALERAMSGSYKKTSTPDKSGAPSLSVEDLLLAFMKPFLFLLTGLLLL